MDKSTLIPIGLFSKLTDLSPRLLRRLDERSLLSPVFVDPDTRYRYDDLSQTRTATCGSIWNVTAIGLRAGWWSGRAFCGCSSRSSSAACG